MSSQTPMPKPRRLNMALLDKAKSSLSRKISNSGAGLTHGCLQRWTLAAREHGKFLSSFICHNVLMHCSVPVWDCTKHFVQDCCQDIDSFSPASVLSQKDWWDPYLAGEIEDGALVAVIHTASIYKRETDFTSTISLKIAGVCVLALPKTSH